LEIIYDHRATILTIIFLCWFCSGFITEEGIMNWHAFNPFIGAEVAFRHNCEMNLFSLTRPRLVPLEKSTMYYVSLLWFSSAPYFAPTWIPYYSWLGGYPGLFDESIDWMWSENWRAIDYPTSDYFRYENDNGYLTPVWTFNLTGFLLIWFFTIFKIICYSFFLYRFWFRGAILFYMFCYKEYNRRTLAAAYNTYFKDKDEYVRKLTDHIRFFKRNNVFIHNRKLNGILISQIHTLDSMAFEIKTLNYDNGIRYLKDYFKVVIDPTSHKFGPFTLVDHLDRKASKSDIEVWKLVQSTNFPMTNSFKPYFFEMYSNFVTHFGASPPSWSRPADMLTAIVICYLMKTLPMDIKLESKKPDVPVSFDLGNGISLTPNPIRPTSDAKPPLWAFDITTRSPERPESGRGKAKVGRQHLKNAVRVPKAVPRKRKTFSAEFDYAKDLSQAYMQGQIDEAYFFDYLLYNFGIDDPGLFFAASYDIDLTKTYNTDRRSFYEQMEYNYDDRYPDDMEYDQEYQEHQYDEDDYNKRVLVVNDKGETTWRFANAYKDNYNRYEDDYGHEYDDQYPQQVMAQGVKLEALVKVDPNGNPLVRSIRVDPKWLQEKYPDDYKSLLSDEFSYCGPFPLDLERLCKHVVNPVGIKSAAFLDLFRRRIIKDIEYKPAMEFTPLILDIILANDLPVYRSLLGKVIKQFPTFTLCFYNGTFVIVPTELIPEGSRGELQQLLRILEGRDKPVMDYLKDLLIANKEHNDRILESIRSLAHTQGVVDEEPRTNQDKPIIVIKVDPQPIYKRKMRKFSDFRKLDSVKNLSREEQVKKWNAYCCNPLEIDTTLVKKESKDVASQPSGKNAKPFDPSLARFPTLKQYHDFYGNSMWGRKLETPRQWEEKFEDYKLKWVGRDRAYEERELKKKSKIQSENAQASTGVFSFEAPKKVELSLDLKSECKLANTMLITCPMEMAKSLTFYRGKPDEGKSLPFRPANREKFEGNGSLIAYNNQTYLAIPAHFIHGLKKDDYVTLVGKSSSWVGTIAELALMRNPDHKREDLLLSTHPSVICLGKAHPVECIRGKKYQHQVQMTYITDNSPSGVYMSVGNVIGLGTEITAVDYNSEEGTCGAPVIGNQNRCLGIHVATANTFNCFLSFIDTHFDKLTPLDF
jgi:hypothetical protein